MATPRIGQKVKVFSGDGKTFIGAGKYIGSKDGIPKLKVGKKTYFGYECWWITESEAKKVEKKYHEKG